MIGCIAGLLGGTSLVFVNSRYFRKRSFGFALLTTAFTYISIFLIVNVFAVFFTLKSNNNWRSITSTQYFNEWRLLLDGTFLSNFIFWGFITLFTLFLLQVNDKFGPGMLIKFLMGNYYQPKKEERIFMFMDMKSSTTIAEQIGNEKYFNLLNDVFADLTDVILNHQGEIYQYVGDEIVISWTMKKGVKNANYIHCFLEIQKKLVSISQVYKEKYGVSPEFKAGVHHGNVMAGEIGVIKKDIIYSGDVLNTTARIQEQCKHYKTDLLLSKETFELVAQHIDYKLEHLGNIELRGRKSTIDLCTLKPIS